MGRSQPTVAKRLRPNKDLDRATSLSNHNLLDFVEADLVAGAVVVTGKADTHRSSRPDGNMATEGRVGRHPPFISP